MSVLYINSYSLLNLCISSHREFKHSYDNNLELLLSIETYIPRKWYKYEKPKKKCESNQIRRTDEKSSKEYLEALSSFAIWISHENDELCSEENFISRNVYYKVHHPVK